MLAFASIKSHEANFSLSSALTRQSYKGEEKRKKEKKKRKKEKKKERKKKKKRKKKKEKRRRKKGDEIIAHLGVHGMGTFAVPKRIKRIPLRGGGMPPRTVYRSRQDHSYTTTLPPVCKRHPLGADESFHAVFY